MSDEGNSPLVDPDSATILYPSGTSGWFAVVQTDRGAGITPSECHLALRVLHYTQGQRACYWKCPFCLDYQASSALEFAHHVEAQHEGFQCGPEGAICCKKCSSQVQPDSCNPLVASHSVNAARAP